MSVAMSMYRGHRVVAVTPAGRRRYLLMLFEQLQKYHEAGVLDEYRLWCNTVDEEDIAFMQELEAVHSWIRVVYLPDGASSFKESLSIHHFWRECTEDNTIYVRFDDDVILVQPVSAFKSFLDFRLDNEQYFMVYATILNNAVITHVLQNQGRMPTDIGVVSCDCLDPVGWKSGEFAAKLHDVVLDELHRTGTLDKFLFGGPWVAHNNERVSINCLAWLGRAFRVETGGCVDEDEELDIACTIPGRIGKPNAVFGGYAVVHFAFHTQRSYLEERGYLAKYRVATVALREHLLE